VISQAEHFCFLERRAAGDHRWAHSLDGKRFVVRADEKLTAFVELERAIREFAVSLIS